MTVDTELVDATVPSWRNERHNVVTEHRTRPGMLRERGVAVSDWPGHPHHDGLARKVAAGVELGETDRELWHRLLRPDLALDLFAVRYGRKGERRPRRPAPTVFDPGTRSERGTE